MANKETAVDRASCYFIPNGIITYEDCPICGAPGMRVGHGKDGRGSLQHFEYCVECGDSMPVVCYDCKYCKIILEANMKHGNDWLAYDVLTTDADARKLATVRLGVTEESIEIRRTGGAILARAKLEANDGD